MNINIKIILQFFSPCESDNEKTNLFNFFLVKVIRRKQIYSTIVFSFLFFVVVLDKNFFEHFFLQDSQFCKKKNVYFLPLGIFTRSIFLTFQIKDISLAVKKPPYICNNIVLLLYCICNKLILTVYYIVIVIN